MQHSRVVTERAPLGFGNPEAAISYRKQIATGELPRDVDEYAAERILSADDLVPIRDSDDGCIDGRHAVGVHFLSGDQWYDRPIDDPSDHERAKVAGGGYVTALAMKCATGALSEHIDTDLADVVQTLSEAGLYCGAHTGAHHTATTTDCGANDKIDRILASGVEHADAIGKVTEELLAVAEVPFDQARYDSVIAGWSRVKSRPSYADGSSGASRFHVIEDGIRAAQHRAESAVPLAVSKNLSGDHKEDYIIINYVAGTTFSQSSFRDHLSQRFPDTNDEQLAQAFVIDVDRIIELAQAYTRGASDDAFTTALYAGVAYQLATASVLTDGSLRTFVITE